MSEKQILFHWDKHHRAYYTNIATLLKDKQELQRLPLEKLIIEAKKQQNQPLFNNAAQAYNHTFFWKCINVDESYSPIQHPNFTKLVQEAGGIQHVFDNLSEVATKHFGSGWAWLIINSDGKLEVKAYHDADTPIANNEHPLLTIDVWEHAYYVRL